MTNTENTESESFTKMLFATMITCYVWMTGFGNFSFFYLKGDYSSVRVMQMLWRLNFLVIFLPFLRTG